MPHPARPLRDLAPEALAALWPAAVLAWRRTLPVEVFSLSEDDFSRTLDAFAVSRGEPFPTDMWPPGPAWLAGALMRAGVPLHAAPAVLNLLSVTIALVLASDVARRLGVGPWARLAAVAAVALGPWPAWLGLSGLAEPPAALGFALLAHGIVRVVEHGRGARAQVCAGAALAALCRYEAWALAIAAAGFLATRREARAVALLPLVVPIGWTALEHHWSHSFEFLTNARTILESTDWRPTGAAYYAELVGTLLDAAGPLLPLALFGMWCGRTDARAAPVFAVWTATALVHLAAGALDYGATHNPARVWLGHAVLVPVGLALVLDRLRPVLTGALLAGTAAFMLPRWEPVPEGYDADTLAIATQTRAALAGSPAESTVVVEAIPWSCVAMKALIGAPERVVWDRIADGEPISETHPSILLGRPEQIEAELAGEHARFVVTASPEIADSVARVAEPVARAGDWTLWRR